MKTKRFWSIIMMLVLVLGTATVLTSCGDDEEEVNLQNQERKNAIVINGVPSDITEATISLEDDMSQIHLYTSTSSIVIKFWASEVPIGKEVEADYVEIEHAGEIVEDGPYRLSITVTDDEIYTIDLPKSKRSYEGKETIFSVYYKGKLTACVEDNYQHYVGISYPQASVGFTYADQAVDSVCFITYDSYNYYPHSSNPDNFISIDEKYASRAIMNNSWGYYFSLPVYFKPNTTGSCRLGHVVIDSKSEMDNWSATTYATYLQCNWHCIEKPAPRYKYNNDGTMINGCEHLMLDSALQVVDTIRFYPFDNWSITSSNPDIIKPTVNSGSQFRNKRPVTIPCTVAQNLTKDTIRTTLTITSECGATTTINFKQAPQKRVK